MYSALFFCNTGIIISEEEIEAEKGYLSRTRAGECLTWIPMPIFVPYLRLAHCTFLLRCFPTGGKPEFVGKRNPDPGDRVWCQDSDCTNCQGNPTNEQTTARAAICQLNTLEVSTGWQLSRVPSKTGDWPQNLIQGEKPLVQEHVVSATNCKAELPILVLPCMVVPQAQAQAKAGWGLGQRVPLEQWLPILCDWQPGVSCANSTVFYVCLSLCEQRIGRAEKICTKRNQTSKSSKGVEMASRSPWLEEGGLALLRGLPRGSRKREADRGCGSCTDRLRSLRKGSGKGQDTRWRRAQMIQDHTAHCYNFRFF